MKPIVLALIYDFDKTLATNDMQAFRFIPDLDMTPAEFWGKTAKFSEENHCERILSYLYTMMIECQNKGIKLTEQYLNSLGKYVEYFEGVTTWFDRINKYGEEHGVKIEHYIISSGNREILKGTEIANKFTKIFACNFVYNQDGIACWPKMIINYTSKTQCLFRISKGILDIREDDMVNAKVAEKHVEFNNMIYIGDGITDIPCMTLIKERNGLSIAVYSNELKNTAEPLVFDKRVDAAASADYREGSKLDKLVKAKIDLVSLSTK